MSQASWDAWFGSAALLFDLLSQFLQLGALLGLLALVVVAAQRR